MEKNKKVTITIQGDKYTIKGNYSEEYINKIAKHVDNIMEQLSRSNPFMNKNMIAILCSLNLADQLYKVQENISQLEDKLLENEELSNLKKELEITKDTAKFHLEKLREVQRKLTKENLELEKYKEMVKNYQNRIKENKLELDSARQTITELQNQVFDNQIEIVKMKKELDEYRQKEKFSKKNFSNQRGKK
ncbi:cell division protein ZapA [Garciella nitratireducens]|uniref:cell division protein ZapA n=1 Tax=Garciella nitratireducens TaxID=218205 RepID=UPI001BD2363D|nr:cell division protein ZapA [Garciella nitratireducens]